MGGGGVPGFCKGGGGVSKTFSGINVFFSKPFSGLKQAHLRGVGGRPPREFYTLPTKWFAKTPFWRFFLTSCERNKSLYCFRIGKILDEF